MAITDLAACFVGNVDIVFKYTARTRFGAYLLRLLNRLIRFQLCRACQCPSESLLPTDAQGVHSSQGEWIIASTTARRSMVCLIPWAWKSQEAVRGTWIRERIDVWAGDR